MERACIHAPAAGASLLIFLPAILCPLVFALLLSAAPAAGATVPQAASAAGREMDRQMEARFGRKPGEGAAGTLSLSVTTPVNINDLDDANPLARQMQEEAMRWFVRAGYDVQEIRKGADVLFEPLKGEQLLTRREKLVDDKSIQTDALLVGTYVVTPDNVRFNFRVVRAVGRDILAMSTVTLPMNREIAFLTRRTGPGGALAPAPIEPTVVTLLP
ncbi:MAG: hypothetical protein LBQ51_03730 [Desulfovibrio sp.]|jgi:hypothetical protein|nr:hypothetical protein [Desulfovibrio sp.]